jgi:hypothetical protein
LNHRLGRAQLVVMAEYSYLIVNLPRSTSRDVARQILTDHAEYGHWELAKVRLAADGSRTATLRRKIIRPTRSGVSPDLAGGLSWRP